MSELIIGAVILENELSIFECDFIFLKSALKRLSALRDDNDSRASDFLELLKPLKVNQRELVKESVGAQFEIHFMEFVPTILIDFDKLECHCSHPESLYLNFEASLPNQWRYCDSSVFALLARLECFPFASYWHELEFWPG